MLTEGSIADTPVRLVKPTTYMNGSGAALVGLRALEDFDIAADLMVVVDDAMIDVGRIRMRPAGGNGGHNGLESVEAVLGTERYPRLRIGVGKCPEGMRLSDWVLSDFPPEEEETVLALLPEVSAAVKVWIEDGIDSAMNRLNR